ncbi:MAG: electron transfer flavoprotein subunit beta/FixA family protein [candidate division WOR-3 bacterium]|nr:electron transfer flavoprotein subunit beta/FixA family protein [candidate division WOR-3 bacterium]MCX7757503.1 electron transfer flavoprotein subunit beta/FixA family protein [candidate division WOR-3 bacterium]MDW7987159.1 electron transfer flavoprotein subunit beta/FixA family protein [candidate division WOR-3 bacterium]
MEIFVCLKLVPNTQDTEVRIDSSKRDILKVRLSYTINEADDYALEAALQLKEKVGGQITVITVGEAQADEMLRMALAKGADQAIRLSDEVFTNFRYDPLTIAYLLAKAISQYKYDLILTGAIASDDGYSAVGPALAGFLKIPSAAYVTYLELIDNQRLKVSRELEGGLLENKELALPCVLSIQTGINKPRYASILGIKRASSKPLTVLNAGQLNVNQKDLKMFIDLVEMYYPEIVSKAQIISGNEEEISEKLALIIKEKVGL